MISFHKNAGEFNIKQNVNPRKQTLYGENLLKNVFGLNMN